MSKLTIQPENIKPKMVFHNNKWVVKVMTRYHLHWRCLCLFYVNSDDALTMVVLNDQPIFPIELCSAQQYVSDTRAKTEEEILRSEILERFKARLGITNHSVRFVYKLAQLGEWWERYLPQLMLNTNTTLLSVLTNKVLKVLP